MHGDHPGDSHNKAPNSGSCDAPDVSVSALPNSNTVNIALAKNAKIVTGSEMPPLFREQIKGEFHGYYQAKLAVINIGNTFTTGPTEAAYVINELVRPVSVIASHANEVATKGGKVLPGTKTGTFIKVVKVPVYVPLSGKTIEFNSEGTCVAGC